MSEQALWTDVTAASATKGQSTGPWRATGISIDSRSIVPGDLFFAIRGPKYDGHDFVASALFAGAAAAVVDCRPSGLPDNARLLMVNDTMLGLESLGREARKRVSGKIIGITGSVGKTGTKEALQLALGRHGITHASRGNLNNQWGVPLSLARMPRLCDFSVFELAMSRAGEIFSLTKLVRPNVAIITNISHAHLEFLKSEKNIADAKAEIFSGLEPGGIAILNSDCKFYGRLKNVAEDLGVDRIISFGTRKRADVRLVKIASHSSCSCIVAEVDGVAVTYKIGLPGRHWAINSLAVLAAVKALDADLGKAAIALADMTPLSGRGRRHHIEASFGKFELIDDSYNASPVSVRAAASLLSDCDATKSGKKILVLGDMLELGAQAVELHRVLSKDIALLDIDLVFGCGVLTREVIDALPNDMRGTCAQDSEGLLKHLTQIIQNGDVILVKGSFGMKMQYIVLGLMALGESTSAKSI